MSTSYIGEGRLQHGELRRDADVGMQQSKRTDVSRQGAASRPLTGTWDGGFRRSEQKLEWQVEDLRREGTQTM